MNSIKINIQIFLKAYVQILSPISDVKQSAFMAPNSPVYPAYSHKLTLECILFLIEHASQHNTNVSEMFFKST